jgi:glycosyltransferase involved in cell wall biosynthesis
MPALTLSVVVPIFNEEGTVEELHARLTAAVAPLDSYELVLVDDGSSDRTWELLAAIAAGDPHVRLVRLSRNFGHQVALTAGVDAARGDAIVTMDGDLQDPPEVIPELVAQWREGFDVVYGVRVAREGETRFKLWTASLFYRLIRRMSPVDIPQDAGDFRLLSRRAADAFRSMPERARFIRGMTSWVGFRQVGVPYRREARYAGTTKYPTRKMLRFALDAITSFSTTPLRVMSAFGFSLVGLCGLYLAYALYKRFLTDDTVEGWTTVIVLVLLIGGAQLIGLGVIGQYVGRIYEESKNRPLYVVSEVLHGGNHVSPVDPLLHSSSSPAAPMPPAGQSPASAADADTLH